MLFFAHLLRFSNSCEFVRCFVCVGLPSFQSLMKMDFCVCLTSFRLVFSFSLFYSFSQKISSLIYSFIRRVLSSVIAQANTFPNQLKIEFIAVAAFAYAVSTATFSMLVLIFFKCKIFTTIQDKSIKFLIQQLCLCVCLCGAEYWFYFFLWKASKKYFLKEKKKIQVTSNPWCNFLFGLSLYSSRN